MRPKRAVIVLVAVLGVFCFIAGSQAEIYKFNFNVWTYREFNQPDRIAFYVDLEDTLHYPQEAISSLTVKAPNGVVFDMTNFCYLDLIKQFWAGIPLSSFPGLTKFPAGTYTATVKDKSTPVKTLTNSDTLSTIAFLPLPNITNPTEGEIFTSLQPVLTWDPVPGAQYYRIHLFWVNVKEPVYWKNPINPRLTYRNSFSVPRGALRRNSQYSLQIEARDSDKNTNKASRSKWINFSTSADATP